MVVWSREQKEMFQQRRPTQSPHDRLLLSRVPNSFIRDVYLYGSDSDVRAGGGVAARSSVKEDSPGQKSHLYPMDVPAGLYAQAHYKGAPLKAWSGECKNFQLGLLQLVGSLPMVQGVLELCQCYNQTFLDLLPRVTQELRGNNSYLVTVCAVR